MKKKSTLKEELIASILDEGRKFDMGTFKRGSLKTLATCNTALCMAGHIEALRPALAKKLMPQNTEWDFVDHANIAREIWERETGEKCRLDFFASRHPDELGAQARAEAVAHIRGRSKRWPLLALLVMALAGCDTVLSAPNFENSACSVVDCNDAETLAEVVALPERGAVAAQLECNTIAVGANGSVARVYYQATRTVDGACLASTSVQTGGVVASGSNVWQRGAVNAGTCLARAFGAAFAPVFVRIEGSQLRVEAPGCTTAPGTACTVSTAFCSGDEEAF